MRFFLIPMLIVCHFAKAQYIENSKPNIIFILVDDLGYGDLSIMGARDLQTPHIDNLFSNGVNFSQFYANSSVCSPSRAALLTGNYPDIAGVPGVIRQWENESWGYLKPGITTLPEVLKKAGYQTAMIGKWHLGLQRPNTPTDKGFEYFKGFLADMMDDYFNHLRGGENWMRENDKIITPEGHATDLFTRWSVEYINQNKASDKPFFLYLAYNAPHDPIQPPPAWLTKVKDREKDIGDERAGIVALIEHLDEGIGKVINSVKEAGIEKNTLIVFASDNGGSLQRKANNGPLRGGKQDMYEGGLRVPAGIYWPGTITPAKNDSLVVLMDMFPTICDIAGADIPAELPSVSMLPILAGQKMTTNDRTIFYMRREGFSYNGLAYYAVRKGDFKLVQNTPYEPFQFFNIKEDLAEKEPLPENCDPCNMMKKELKNHINKSGAIPWKPGP